MRSPLATRILPNFLGKGWSAGALLVSTPVYLQLLGPRYYGLVGFLATVQYLFAVVDMGFSSAIGREMAQLRVHGNHRRAADALFTLQAGILALSIAGGILWAIASPLVASRWLHTDAATYAETSWSLLLMGPAIATQLALTFYIAALAGQGRQILQNVLVAAVTTLRIAGSIALLVEGYGVVSFFAWQSLSSLLGVLLLGWACWRSPLLREESSSFSKTIILENKHYFLGMILVFLTSVVLNQADRILLSGTVSLHEFGIYSAALVLPGFALNAIGALLAALYPLLSEAALRSRDELLALYRAGCWLAGALTLPFLATVGFLAVPCAAIWTGSNSMSMEMAPILRILALSMSCHVLLHVPYNLQMARSYTRWNGQFNLILLLPCLASTWLLVARCGSTGAALAQFALNAATLLFFVPALHRKLGYDELGDWLFRGAAKPMVAAAIGPALLSLALPGSRTPRGLGNFAAIAAGLALSGALFAILGRKELKASVGLFIRRS